MTFISIPLSLVSVYSITCFPSPSIPNNLLAIVIIKFLDARCQMPDARHQKPRSHVLTLSRLTPHVSRLTFHVSRLTPHASRLTSHASRLTPHASRLTPHVSRLTPHVCSQIQFEYHTLLLTFLPNGLHVHWIHLLSVCREGNQY